MADVFPLAGVEYRVEEIEKVWQEPGKRLFKAITNRVRLSYATMGQMPNGHCERSEAIPEKGKINSRLLRRMRFSQ